MLIANPPFAGLSPRMRGNPACYPRKDSGLSPRMRGNPPHHSRTPRAHAGELWPNRYRFRSIPAHAGEPSRSPGQGLSPRMRGNHLDIGVLGSIPAHAGEPMQVGFTVRAYRVYPRACGGTTSATLGRAHAGEPPGRFDGLSPRMRGNRKPTCRPRMRVSSVYPRACGGTREARAFGDLPGLSPRMRGNHHLCNAQIDGSIPAHAGEPVTRYRSPGSCRIWVYPRACGGTFTSSGRVYPRACGGTRYVWL